MKIRAKNIILLILGSLILAFGLFNIHSFSGVTEGGTLGLTLLFENLFSISPAISSVILNGICYLIGFRTLGKLFIIYSAIATGGFSLFYFIFEKIGALFPWIAEMPIPAAILGALFVGVGVGLCVRAGGAPCGDDALAMSLSSLFKVRISIVYLLSDLAVLSLSLLYIPPLKLLYSLLTVVLSGQLIGIIEGFGKKSPRPSKQSEDGKQQARSDTDKEKQTENK